MKELSSTTVLEQDSGDMIKIHTKGTENLSTTYTEADGVGRWSFIAKR